MEVIDFLKSVRRIRSLNRNPAISDEDIESLINQVDMVKENEKQNPYPILNSRPTQYIPQGLLMVHESQAWENHGQSLYQLKQRGGLSWAEALAIIEGKKWSDAIQAEKEAESIVKKLAEEFLNCG